MSDEIKAQDANQDSPTLDGGETKSTRSWLDTLPPDAAKEIENLRDENKKWRRQLRAVELEQKAIEEQRLAEQGKWQELAASLQRRLDELQPVAERAEEASRAIAELERAFTASMDERISRIPEDRRKTLVEPVRKALKPVDFAQWLAANESALLPPKPPPLNAGEQGIGKPPLPALTPEQQAFARGAGMTNEQYAAQLARINEKRGNSNG